MQAYYCGPFTLMMHNHIHNNGVLAKSMRGLITPFRTYWNRSWVTHGIPTTIIVKHHHVEGNGPDDLSSTIRYQRDQLTIFLPMSVDSSHSPG
jgi:phosphoinositide-3-kinase regulatory subunit 4